MTNYPNSPLDFLNNGVKNNPEKTALLGRGRTFSWQDMYREIAGIASWLVEQGVTPGKRVALVCRGNIDLFLLMFGVWTAGGVVAPINVSLPPSQREIILKKLRPHMSVVDNTLFSVEKLPGILIKWEGHVPESEAAFSPYVPDPDELAMIMFTSGTTGIPKGVMISHRILATNSYLTGQVLKVTGADRILINTPAYYTSAICHMMTLFSVGGSLVTHQGFLFGETFLGLIKEFNCTGFGGAPAHFARVFSTIKPNSKPEGFRFIMNSGDHLPDHLLRKALEIFPGIELFCVYGLSEVGGRLCILPPDKLPEKINSVGFPLPGMKVSILTEDTLEPVKPMKTGSIFVDGHLLIKEYFEDPESSRNLNYPAGFRTGDIGYIDREGYLFVKGREDDIFKSGGEKVSALMIQQTLSSFEEFDDVAVVPVEDDLLMKVPGVFYVSAPGIEFDKNRVINKLQELLPPNHIPTRYIALEQIPRTGSGKVIRGQLPGFEKVGGRAVDHQE